MSQDLKGLLREHKDVLHEISGGRLKCTLTGHEMVTSLDAVRAYLSSKLYKYAQVGIQLKQFEPHIVQSPEYKDKVVCKLTGALINRNEDAIWKHMLGKKFEKALAKEEELVKSKKVKQPEIPLENSMEAMEIEGSKSEDQGDEKSEPRRSADRAPPHSSRKNTKKLRETEKTRTKNGGLSEVNKGEESEEEVDFWRPPAGMRWDNDDGGRRWREDEGEEEEGNKKKTGQNPIGNVALSPPLVPAGEGPGEEEEEDFFGRKPSDSKRTSSSSVGGRTNVSQKKKKKKKA